MYRIFLTDNINYVELDTEDISMETVFSVSDISDISSRKDTITKSIAFKGTQNNNKAFGYHFFLNKNVDGTLDNHLFFNYIPSHKVDCKVFEDSVLILNGSMLLTGASIDKSGNIIYNTIITGKVVSLKSSLGDKTLADIDFTDLKHQYNKAQIINSWGIGDFDDTVAEATQRYDPDTDTYYYEPFELGSGYVYPFIDYGEKFINDDYNKDYSIINVHNYRPAIYLREYMSRIFKDAGYTYEIKADSEFIERFNRLIIPDDNEVFRYNRKLTKNWFKRDSTSTSIDKSVNPINDNTQYVVHPLPLPVKDYSDFTDYGPEFGTNNKQYTVIQFKKSVATDIQLTLKVDSLNNYTNTVPPSAIDADVIVQIVKRGYSDDDTSLSGWESIGEQSIRLTPSQTVTDYTFNISVGETQFQVGDQISIFFKTTYWEPPSNTKDSCNFTITDISLSIANYPDRLYNVNLSYDDYIIPKIPSNIKQIDFVKSVLTLLNLYVYNNKENPTHLYLQPYDDFYSLCAPQYLAGNSLNWTEKVDYSNNISINSNLNLATAYNFTFKEDADYLNKTYKNKYGEVYGAYSVNDSSGLSDEKTVSVVFSPTPTILIPGQNRLYGFMADGGTSILSKKPVKTNIRVLFYNGGAYCDSIKYAEDTINNNAVQVVETKFSLGIYAQASNYHLQIVNDTVNKVSVYNFKYDIHFSSPREYYFNSDDNPDLIPASKEYYTNQVQEMVNPNIFTIECNAWLNSTDIGNLDFHTPVFIDTGLYGYSYFKLLSVEYVNKATPSKITLQKIVAG